MSDELEIDLPASALVTKYDPDKAQAEYARTRVLRSQKYSYEKFMGDRTETGVKPLKTLKPIHRHIVARFLAGEAVVDIALDMNVDALTVYRVVNDPLVKRLINEWQDGVDEELGALRPAALDVIRTALNSEDVKIGLLGVDRLAKMTATTSEGRGSNKDAASQNAIRSAASEKLASFAARIVIREGDKTVSVEVVPTIMPKIPTSEPTNEEKD